MVYAWVPSGPGSSLDWLEVRKVFQMYFLNVGLQYQPAREKEPVFLNIFTNLTVTEIEAVLLAYQRVLGLKA